MVSDSVSDNESHDIEILIHFSENQIPDFDPYISIALVSTLVHTIKSYRIKRASKHRNFNQDNIFILKPLYEPPLLNCIVPPLYKLN